MIALAIACSVGTLIVAAAVLPVAYWLRVWVPR